VTLVLDEEVRMDRSPWIVRLCLVAGILLTLSACSSDEPAGSTGTTGSSATETTGSTGTSGSPTGSATAEPAAADLSGTWDGTWTDTSPDTSSGTFELVWQQDGSSLDGTITVHGTACLTDAGITGVLSGGQISFGAVEGQVTISYDGDVAGDGASMQGTYQASASCANATGDWKAHEVGG
jgi:hypothetical protein